MLKEYFGKMKGVSTPPPAPGSGEIALGFAGSCIALGLVGALHTLSMNLAETPLMMAPFGASAVLLFGAFRSPLAQPRNVIGGHVISAFAGVSVYLIINSLALGATISPILAVSIAVPLAIALMHKTRTLHPPGGATAFLAAVGGGEVHALGYWYVLAPCAIGSALMVLVALAVNNMPQKNRYPQFWL